MPVAHDALYNDACMQQGTRMSGVHASRPRSVSRQRRRCRRRWRPAIAQAQTQVHSTLRFLAPVDKNTT